MYAESRKLQLIEEVLKVNDDHLLSELETVFKKSKSITSKELSLNDFVGVLTKKDSTEMKKACLDYLTTNGNCLKRTRITNSF